MIEPSVSKGVLVLEDGREFEGTLMGAPLGDSGFELSKDAGYGEVVFNTSMTGYQEILTDPSYYGQIVCMTHPHIGNTGINEDDQESIKPWCAGWIMRDATDQSPHWRASEDLDAFLKRSGIPALTGVDTRALTLHLRKMGVCRGLILEKKHRSLAADRLKQLPTFEGRDLIREVTTKTAYLWNAPPRKTEKKHRVVAMDFGIKWNLLRSLSEAGCDIQVVPAFATAEEILAEKPAGVFLSNGPGDPQAAPYAVETIRALLGKLPIFGVCMGHQLLALALGAKTFKLKFGHRGGNQPVFEDSTGRVEISSHNHGYAVDADSLPPTARVTHINLNDKTVEGLEAPKLGAFSVQYHPEACPGPHDSQHLFSRFVRKMDENRMGTS